MSSDRTGLINLLLIEITPLKGMLNLFSELNKKSSAELNVYAVLLLGSRS